MTHRQIFKKVCDFIDGELDEATCNEIKKHITACPKCRIYIDTVGKTIVFYQVKDAPKRLPAAARKRLHATVALKLKEKR
ncbi:MAG: anti-sigma factor [candidate division KSB1 bacterium]|nr:anti-sigma factor [candidate division KSB1 bacterium]MDZ7304449.1 anti-sigma factor [candidate division KSB1 bacterium]MDZ7310942.1 anti-sigma factor [candidate division KSB1 bacterium]